MQAAGAAATPKSYQASSRAAPFKAEGEAAQQLTAGAADALPAAASSAASASSTPPSPHRTSLSLGGRRGNKVVPQPLFLPRRAEEEAAAEGQLSLRVALPVSPLAISSPSSSPPKPHRQQNAAPEALRAAGRPSLPRLILSPSSSSPSIRTLEEQQQISSELLSPSELAPAVEGEDELADEWDLSDCCGCFSLGSPSSTRPPSSLSGQRRQHAALDYALGTPVPASQPAEAERVWDKRLSTGHTPPPVHLLKPPPPFPRASSLPLQQPESRVQWLHRTLRRSFNTDSLTAALKRRRWGGGAGAEVGAAAGGGGEVSSSPTAVSTTADLLRAMPVELRSAMGLDSPASSLQPATERRRPDQLQPEAVSGAAGKSSRARGGDGRGEQQAEQAGRPSPQDVADAADAVASLTTTTAAAAAATPPSAAERLYVT